MGVATAGALSKLCMKPAAAPTWDGSSEPYEFLSEGLRKQSTIIETGGIRGTRSRPKERTREGIYTVGGPIVMNPSPATLDDLLPRILGTAEATDVFALAETLETVGIFSVLFNRVTDVFEYNDCRVNRATFRASSGNPLELTLDIVGKTQKIGTTYPTLTLGTAANYAPYVFHEGVLTIKSGAREMFDFELVIDNFVDSSFRNSQTSTSLIAMDRLVTLRTSNPFTSSEWTALQSDITGSAVGSLVFTNGNMALTFTFASLQWPESDPVVTGKTEVPMTLEMVARQSGSTLELVVTNDSTA